VLSGLQHIQWYQRIYDQALSSLKGPNVSQEVLHGSLIALGELLRQSGTFMSDKYKTVADIILKHLTSNNRLIKQTVISLLPVLARYNKSEFTQHYLPSIMTQLLAALRRENERSHAFMAVGKIALAITDHIKEYLDQIMPLAKTNMMPKTRAQSCNEVLSCLSMLGAAVGPALQPHIKELLTPMFSVGLTPTLVEALTSLTVHIPDLAFDIQIRLLDLLSQVLAQKPFTYVGLPYSARRLHTPSNAINTSSSGGGGGGSGSGSGGSVGGSGGGSTGSSTLSSSSSTPLGGGAEGSASSSSSSPSQDPTLITLALRTLGTFEFDKYLLVEFLHDTVLHFVEHDNVAIRKEAVITCCKLMIPPNGRSIPTRGHAASIFSHVLHTLLRVAISDSDPAIRLTVLISLEPCFDSYLSQCDIIRMLFAALNDEVFEIREVVMGILGRITSRNPAYILPGLRKKLVELLTDLEYSSDSRTREQSARQLGSLIGGGTLSLSFSSIVVLIFI
jgi:FKBP12-rapamycin complex-associated protein